MSYATPIVIIRYGEKKPEVKKSVMGCLLPELKRMRLSGVFLTAWIDKKEKYVRIFASQNGEVPKRIFKIGCSTNFVRSSRWIGRTCNFYRYGKGTEAGTVLENFEFGFLTKQKTPKYKEPELKPHKKKYHKLKIHDEEAPLTPAQKLKQKHDDGLTRELSRRHEGVRRVVKRVGGRAGIVKRAIKEWKELQGYRPRSYNEEDDYEDDDEEDEEE